MNIDFNTICRFCMVEDEYLVPIFQEDSSLLARILALVPKVKVLLAKLHHPIIKIVAGLLFQEISVMLPLLLI